MRDKTKISDDLDHATVTAAYCVVGVFFFFSSRRRHTRFDCDWSSDVCSSDLTNTFGGSSTAEFGPLLQLTYPSPNPPGYTKRWNDFRRILSSNPCPAQNNGAEIGRASCRERV